MMKTNPALACCTALLLAGAYVGSNYSRAIPNAVPTPRYQIAGNPSRAMPDRGCYILDTVTGELWHSTANSKPVKVSEKLQ
jgi:hypothetical protein